MISRISLKNFKLHASTVIEAAPITVFIGPNNSGKSSLLQALLALRQAAGWTAEFFCPSPNQARQIVDLGQFKDVVRHGESEIQIGLAGRLEREKPAELGTVIPLEFDVYIRENRLAYHRGYLEYSLPKRPPRIRTWEGEDALEEPTQGKIEWEWAGRNAKVAGIYGEGASLAFSSSAKFRLINFTELEFETSRPNLPAEKVTALQDFGAYLGEAPVKLLNSLHPIFPLRGFEEAGYALPDEAPASLDQLTLSQRAMVLASILAYNRDIERRVSGWLEELVGIRIEHELVRGKRVTFRTERAGARDSGTLLLNEGTGANQLPFILLPIGLTPPKETIFLCEPEAHLHPKAQTHLVRLLLEIAKKEARQLFIETHSEHILHALLHAVPKGQLQLDQLAIYYFENVSGVAQVRRLEVNSKGQVEGGLPGFFEHSLTELAEYLEALKKS